jgi:hypothetical protein
MDRYAASLNRCSVLAKKPLADRKMRARAGLPDASSALGFGFRPTDVAGLAPVRKEQGIQALSGKPREKDRALLLSCAIRVCYVGKGSNGRLVQGGADIRSKERPRAARNV